MPLQGLILRVGGGTFVFRTGAELTAGVRTGYILDGSGSTWTAIFSQVLGESNLFGNFGMRQGIHLDLGGGEHIVELEARGYEGSDLAFGGAGGADPITQMNTLENALVETQIHSFNPATIEYGEYSSSGQFSPLNVVVEEPMITRNAEDPSTFDVNMVFIETASFEQGVFADALKMV